MYVYQDLRRSSGISTVYYAPAFHNVLFVSSSVSDLAFRNIPSAVLFYAKPGGSNLFTVLLLLNRLPPTAANIRAAAYSELPGMHFVAVLTARLPC